MVKLKEEIVLKAYGAKKGGKSFILYKIANFLRDEGFEVILDSLKHNHSISIYNEMDIKEFKKSMSVSEVEKLLKEEGL